MKNIPFIWNYISDSIRSIKIKNPIKILRSVVM
jgi:hypothetical protein